MKLQRSVTKEEFAKGIGELAKSDRLAKGFVDEYTLSCYDSIAREEANEIYDRITKAGYFLIASEE